jgi:3-oxoacyl-[acyl-carrier protein] reductase
VISLAGKRIFITGASRGIGRATALLCARAGADVGITYRTRRADADEVARQIRALGRRAYVGGGDLGDPARVSQVFAEVTAALGGLDGLVVNHGVWPETDTPLMRMAPERWHETIRTNLDAVFLVTRAGLGTMQKSGGRVVMVGSTAGQRGEAFHADYAASKGAMISLVKSLAVECAPDITVNCVAPGWVDTEMSAGPYAGDGKARIAAGIPLQRVASADDIAGPILFLLSDLARHITGEILNVNGGSVLCG